MFFTRYWKTCFDIEPDELEGQESSRGKTFLMNFMTFAVYLLLVLPLQLTLATGAVSYVSQFDVAYYERHCHHYFSLDCPVHDHDSWVCSKIITNCTSPDYPYHCILNTAGKVVHVCAAAQICQKGTVPIFDPRTHTVSCVKCQKGYYQPYEILSNKTPFCMQKFGCDITYHKIECPVEPEMEQTQDTLCRCDARNDYILSNSEGRDICVPGKYANCYEWKCPDGQETLLNYTCARRCEEGFQRDDSDICVPKSTVITTTEGEKTSPTSTASTENSSKGSSSRGSNTVIIVISVIVFVAVIGLIIAFVVYRKRRTCCSQFSQVSTDDNDANTIELVTKNNGTVERSAEDTNENAASRERPNQGNDPIIQHHHHVHVSARNLFNCCTNIRDEAGDRSSRHRLDPQPASSMHPPTSSPDTNANASPRDLPNLERPSQDPADDHGITEALIHVRTGDPDQGTTSHDTNANARPRDIPSWEGSSQEKLHQKVLNRCLPVLMKDLNVDVVMIYIQQKELFDEVTVRDIREQRTTSDAISMLIEKIQQRGCDKYEEFKECLVLASREDLKEKLEEVEANVTLEITETHQALETAMASLDNDISLPGNSLDDF